ncbi:MAG: ABC transporter, ATP-binding protein [Candidatus Woesebacteria bacterium GW2011_GWC2_45_9]|uniref:ABC transporter, ATP-binding protein n=1 Tax=Candidatus Woesebacteria bacterium GW2011_GWC2_45_9 TaxID=1618589 RepID=A0A0G1N6I7_9BACT|nr:MAG: ABC transporter, ATP-binding protein [Candidatus Woesebacteria bacterium GW2011_GWC2_45_9]
MHLGQVCGQIFMLKTLKTFYAFLFKKRAVAVLFLLAVVAASVAGSILPYFYKLFVDAIPSLDFSKLLSILFAYLGIRVLSLILSSASFFLGDVLTIDASADLRETVFKHLHDLDFAFHTDKSSGSLISAIKRGDGAFWNFYFSIHYRLIDVLVSFVVMLYFFKALDWRIFILVIVSFLFALGVTYFFIKGNIKTRKTANKLEDRISGVVVDNMINFETVKLFAKELRERLRLKKVDRDWKKAVWKYVLTFRGLDIGMGAVINASIFLLFLLALRLTISGELTIGDFVLVVGFSGSFYPKIFELVWGFRDLAKSYSDIERYFGLLDYQVEVKDPKNPIKPKGIKGEIEYKNVSFSYEDKQADAIKNINFTIRQGQSIALVGRSGVGKTTLVKLLMRFYDVDKGSITIDGTDVKRFTKSDLRSLMGVVPQEPVLFNSTIGHNIGYGKVGVTKKEIIAAAKLARIDEFIETLPKKYDTKVGERGIKLSGGQKQRVAIARMILSEPEIIIFDEATSQLDSESEKLIQEAFWKAAKDKTTIIVAHRLSTVMRADKIVVMEEGKIKEMGSHRELLAKKDSLYRHFWDLQIKLD